jgi:hypothetical protein
MCSNHKLETRSLTSPIPTARPRCLDPNSNLRLVFGYGWAVLLEWSFLLPRLPCSAWVSQPAHRDAHDLTDYLPRFLQGGFIPDLILYMSCTSTPSTPPLPGELTRIPTDFYTKNELPIRLSLFWMSLNVCTILASFIAFGVLRMRGILGRAGWRWLFLVEYVSAPQSHYLFLHSAVCFTAGAASLSLLG